jgi:hypothetical protein
VLDHGLLLTLVLVVWIAVSGFASVMLPQSSRQMVSGGLFGVSVLAAGYFANGVEGQVAGISLKPMLLAAAVGGLLVCWILLWSCPRPISGWSPRAPLVACALLGIALVIPRVLGGVEVSPPIGLALLQLATLTSRRIQPAQFGRGLWVGTGVGIACGVLIELNVRVVSEDLLLGGEDLLYSPLLNLVGMDYRIGNALGGPAPFALVALAWGIAAWRYVNFRAWVVAMSASLAVILATAARSVLIIFVLAAGALLLSRQSTRAPRAKAVAGFLAGVALLLGVSRQLTSELQSNLSTATGRTPLWRWTADELLAGDGWLIGRGNWPVNLSQLGAPWDAAHAHSMYFAAWWSAGLAGLLLSVLLIWALVRDGKSLTGAEHVQYLVLVGCLALFAVQEPAFLYGATVAASTAALALVATLAPATSDQHPRVVDDRPRRRLHETQTP